MKWSTNASVTKVFFIRQKYSSPKALNHLPTMIGFHVSLNYLYTNAKKNAIPKNSGLSTNECTYEIVLQICKFYMHKLICVKMIKNKDVCMCLCTYVRTYVRMYVCVCMCMSVCLSVWFHRDSQYILTSSYILDSSLVITLLRSSKL